MAVASRVKQHTYSLELYSCYFLWSSPIYSISLNWSLSIKEVSESIGPVFLSSSTAHDPLLTKYPDSTKLRLCIIRERSKLEGQFENART